MSLLVGLGHHQVAAAAQPSSSSNNKKPKPSNDSSSSPSAAIVVCNAGTGAVSHVYRTDGSGGGATRGVTVLGSGSDTTVVASRQGRATLLAFAWGREEPVGRFAMAEEMGPLVSSTDGTWLVAGGASGSIYAWEASTGCLLGVCKAHYRAVSCLAFALDDSVIVSGSDDAMVHVWDLASLVSVGGENPRPLRTLSVCRMTISGLSCGISQAAFSSLDHSVRVFDIAAGVESLHVSLTCAQQCVLLDVVENVVISGGADGNVYVNSLSSQSSPDSATRILGGHTGPITCLCAVDSQKNVSLASGSEDYSIRLWNIHFSQAVLIIRMEGPVLFATFCTRVFNPEHSQTNRKLVPVILRKFKDDEETMSKRRIAIPRTRAKFDDAELDITSTLTFAPSTAPTPLAIGRSGNKDWEAVASRLYELAAEQIEGLL